MFQKKLIQAVFIVTLVIKISGLAEAKQISKEQAITIAQDSGVSGTWMNAYLSGNHWLVQASSKSANPPALCVIDIINSKIIFKSLSVESPKFLNSDYTYIIGKAEDGQNYAKVTTEDNLFVYIKNLKSWPKSFLGKRVIATGTLHIQKLSSISNSEQLVMENAKWNLSK